MNDLPKLHVYAVACAFGTPEAADPPARLMISVWIAYAPQEAAAMAMDQTHRGIAAQGQKLAPHAGTATFEITEDRLSHMLNALRTGGKGATVTPLQQVPPEPFKPDYSKPPFMTEEDWAQERLRRSPPPELKCDHRWLRQADKSDPLADGWRCGKCGQIRITPAEDRQFYNKLPEGDPA